MTDKTSEGCCPNDKGHKMKAEVEKIKEAIAKVRKGLFDAMDKVVPKEFREHAGNVKKEFLMALRSLIDDEIKRAEEKRAGTKNSEEKEN
jgi:hypothetical protein